MQVRNRLSIRSGFPSRAAPAGLFMAACPCFIMAMVNHVFRRRRPTAADVAAAEARLERLEAELDSAEQRYNADGSIARAHRQDTAAGST
jgi:hypothetical protein